MNKDALFILEQKEAESLAWGDSGVGFTEEELFSVFESTVREEEVSRLFDTLLNKRAIFQVPGTTDEPRYRTRMGESVNLFRNLRQWFHHQSISGAATLVSDFRFIHQPRVYPCRNLKVGPLVDTWKQELNLSETKTQALRALLGGDDSRWSLAGFQDRTTRRILESCGGYGDRSSYISSTVVCAGTSSGKSLAFYLPALATLTDDIIANPEKRVRILAIYPRKELLKDQMHEAWSQARRLDQLLDQASSRKITVGSFFGDTPGSLYLTRNDAKGRSIPIDFLRCVTEGCGGSMQWSISDLRNNKESLSCTACNHRVGSDEFTLTRDRLKKSPPDILFTTTEMLNQRMGDDGFQHLFGVGNQNSISLVLLDEIHTYEGTAGAQTAYLLRRWLRRSGNNPHFVGLSATLESADHFFSDLTSSNPASTELIEPISPNEIEEEGAEYFLALRSDPVSQTALLSTTIQTAMLTTRILDNSAEISNGMWGTRTFLFTDNLDVTNRLFHNLLDAEGWRMKRYGPIEPYKVPLAALRNPNNCPEGIYESDRIERGQNWGLSYQIGHSLDNNNRARIDRTSSQDPGVDPNCDVVVASSTLEVGFNDPKVGAVIQHKAPMNISSYVQRKGRAGRDRSMRPWMITVLSAFGRDRLAFQRYEELSAPKVPPMSLPLRNSHIVKMQAAMATLDWLGMKIGRGSIWHFLCSPNPEQKYFRKAHSGFIDKMAGLVGQVLRDKSLRVELERYVGEALQITDNQLSNAFWEPPRSVLLGFLPHLYNVLTHNWAYNGKDWGSLSNGTPLPGYVSSTLFETLSATYLDLRLDRLDEPSWKSEPFFKTLREYAPGRISKRFAIKDSSDADWLVPNEYEPVSGECAEKYFEFEEAFGPKHTNLGEVEAFLTGSKVLVLEPKEVLTKRLDISKVSDTSNSYSIWDFFITSDGNVESNEYPRGTPLSHHLQSISFFTHQDSEPLEVYRFSLGAKAEIKFSNGDKPAKPVFIWKNSEQAVGVGTRQWVDGFKLEFGFSDDEILKVCEQENIRFALRSAFFQDQVRLLKCFGGNFFLADWISELVLTAVGLEAKLAAGLSAQEVVAVVFEESSVEKLLELPDGMFQMQRNLQGDFEEQKLQEQITRVLKDSDAILALKTSASILSGNLLEDEKFLDWVKGVLADSLAATLHQTTLILMPDVNERSVLVDHLWREEKLVIWLSESEPGGIGVISKLQEIYLEDPLRLTTLILHSIQASDYELLDHDLHSLIKVVCQNGHLKDALSDVRLAESFDARQTAGDALKVLLSEAGFQVSHSFMAVLYSRILRPGSSTNSDKELLGLLNDWVDLENKLNFEIPLFAVSYILAKSSKLEATPQMVFSLMCKYQGLLWVRGSAVRQAALSYYNEFQSRPARTERLVVTGLFKENVPRIEVGDDWNATWGSKFEQSHRVDLLVEKDKVNISWVLANVVMTQVDLNGLLLYPRVTAVKRREDHWIIRAEILEASF